MTMAPDSCPHCHANLAEARAAAATACPWCGASISPPAPPVIPVPPPLPVARPVGSSVWPWLTVVAVILVSALGFVVLLVAIAYAGCAYLMKNFN